MCLVIDDTLIWDNRIDQKMSKYRKKRTKQQSSPCTSIYITNT